ncbi:ATP synthase F1 subunit delta [Emticicia sp. 17c]|uniref:ATP synthase F1 subunit delta n=1 Tax=Emticicia sp. 17c TaxID=3127704 RepID=UPI00301DAD58
MADSIVAYRYAKSLFDLASEKKVIDKVNDDMLLFKEICDDNRQFAVVMNNPIVRHDKKLGILKNIFENRVHDVTFSIFNVLTKKHRENLIYPIADEFQKLYNQQKGIQKATVTTVSPLTDTQRKEFISLIAKTTGKDVILEEKINPNLIGGYVLKIDDNQVDTSIRKKLNELKLTLA